MTVERIDKRTRHILKEARELAKEIELKEEGLRELLMQTVSSPSMDGMPKGSGGHDASAARLAREEAMREDIQRGKERLQRIRRAANRGIKPLSASRRIFYQIYYIDAQKASAARTMARISERTAQRYISDINKKETGG